MFTAYLSKEECKVLPVYLSKEECKVLSDILGKMVDRDDLSEELIDEETGHDSTPEVTELYKMFNELSERQ